MRIVKDPLIHFLAIGAALFVLYGLLNPQSDVANDPKRIVVDRDALLTHLQYRMRAFEPERAEKHLASMPASARKRLIDDYVRQEALYREAKGLGLERNDYIIKLRMIQKIDFISQGFAEAAVEMSDDEVRAHYEANQDRYREPAVITFTHVFFSAEGRGPQAAKALAGEALTALREKGVPFHEALSHGERFPFGVNYVERAKSFVASHFGPAMTQALFALQPTDGVWQGPLTSQFGEHLVMVTKRHDARVPELAEIRERVEADLREEKQKAAAEKALKTIIDRYEVVVDLSDPGAAPNAGKRN